MSKFGKFKDILKISSVVAKPFVPGIAGSILERVSDGLDKAGHPPTPGTDAVKELANTVDAYNNEQDQAIFAIHQRQNELDERLKKAGF